MVQAKPTSERGVSQLMKEVVDTTGGRPKEESVVLSWEEVTEFMGRRNVRELEKGWDVVQEVRDEEVRGWYGLES